MTSATGTNSSWKLEGDYFEAISAGGIFYMLYYDMIPKAHKEGKWLPTFGAVLGFIVGFAIIRLVGG